MRKLAFVLVAFVAGCGGGGSTQIGTSSTPPNEGVPDAGVGAPTPGGGGTPMPGGGGGSGGSGGSGGGAGPGGGGGAGGTGDMGSPGPLTWTSESSGTTQDLLGVWGSAPQNVFAAGRGGVIVHSNGDGNWTTIASGTTDDLTAVWGPSATELYVLSKSSTGSIMLHSTDGGANFSTTIVGPTPQGQTPYSAQQQIWGTSPDDVYAVTGDVYRSTDHGATWSPVLVNPPVMRSKPSMSLWGIWGSSATDFYVVGDLSTAQHGPGDHSQLIRHTTDGGQTWTDFSEGSPVPLYAAWGSGANDVWIVGGATRVRHSTDRGASYPDVEPTWLQGIATSVWGTGASDVYVFCAGKGLIHSTTNGSSWDLVDLPGLTCPGDACVAYGGWSAGARDVYLVGTGGRIFRGH